MWNDLTELQKVQIKRAMMAGALWAGISAGITVVAGLPVNAPSALAEGGLMAGSYWSADYLYDMMGKDEKGNYKPDHKPIDLQTHALLCGGLFAGLMKLGRDSDGYIQNFVAGAGTSYLEDTVYEMRQPKTEETS